MKNIFLILITLLVFSCQDKGEIIFNGKDLKGWVNYGGGKFYAEDEAIVAEAITGLPNSFLHTKKKYQDFELEFDVKVGYRLEFRGSDKK